MVRSFLNRKKKTGSTKNSSEACKNKKNKKSKPAILFIL
jgi:hypothetical protein